MPDIPFTQYLHPDGRQRPVLITRSPEIVEKAYALLVQGFHFDIEELSNGVVSMTAEWEDETVAIRLCPNGPRVPALVDELINEAYERRHQMASEQT